MTLTIDTDNKKITLHEEVLYEKLVSTLETLGINPNDGWLIIPEIKIQTISIPCLRKHYDTNNPWTNPWNTPINEPLTNPYRQPWHITYHDITPPYPYYRDTITCSAEV